MMRARKVDQYYNSINSTTNKPLLYDLFSTTTNYELVPIFSQIWMPVKKYNSTTGKLADGYTYYNVGMSAEEITDLYWTEYGGTYLIGRSEDISIDVSSLMKKVRSIFLKNVGKYLKLIELAGLEWNPLWNVDGEEIRQLLENNGTNDVETGQINTTSGIQWNDTKTTHNVSPYNSDVNVKKAYEDTVSGNGSNIPTGIQRVEYTDGEFTVSSQSPSGSTIASADESTNGLKGKTRYVHNLAKNLNGANEEDYVVDARDTAFGQALKGADKMHVEKLMRHGNIGVTKTTELIRDARDTFAYSIIQEFFDDINKVILIGIYDSIDTVPWWYSGQSSGGQSTAEHPDTGRISSVYNSGYDMIQSVELDEYGHVVGLTTCDGVTKVFTPMTESQYEQTDPKDQSLYMIYE